MKIAAVLVLYKRGPEQSETFRSLRAGLRERPALAAQFSLQLYDNSPQAHPIPALAICVDYTWDAANPGLAQAYNAGLRHALKDGAEWLLLLDQDTVLTPEYLSELAASAASADAGVCALVPKLVHDGGGVHSPHLPPRLSHRPIAVAFTGIAPDQVAAFNSGALMRVSAVEAIGGFPASFPLDFLDHAVFSALQSRGGKVYVLKAALEHDLSTMTLGGDASLARYRKVLAAERAFYTQAGGTPALWYRLRRLKQCAGHVLKQRDKRFALVDLQAALGLLRD